MADDAPKSAVELALERLRQQDEAAGRTQQVLTDEQKAAIAEARNFCEAKLAEMEVLHRSTLARTPDPEARAALERDYRRDRERIVTERDAKIERIRRQQQA